MKLNNLQILRGISALLVCCFHFRNDLNFTNADWGEIVFSQGGIGVPIFFVISGFIMAFTTKKIVSEKGNMVKQILLFFKKRIIRIVPLYYLLTFMWILLGGTILFYFSGEPFSRLIHSLLFLPQNDIFPVLFLGWSLNYEMFFYLIFGIALLFRSQRYIFIITLFILTYIAGLLFNFENAFMLMVTSVLNLYFVTGIVFALLLKKVNILQKHAIIISSMGIILFALQFFKILPTKNPFLSLLIVALFVFSFLLFDFSLKLKTNKFLVFLGDISYSLYLSHPFIDVIFKKIHLHNDLLRLPYFVLKIFAVIALAAFFYYFVEKKITQYLKVKLNA